MVGFTKGVITISEEEMSKGSLQEAKIRRTRRLRTAVRVGFTSFGRWRYFPGRPNSAAFRFLCERAGDAPSCPRHARPWHGLIFLFITVENGTLITPPIMFRIDWSGSDFISILFPSFALI